MVVKEDRFLYSLRTEQTTAGKDQAKMSPGVATPCPAAPPIETANVRFMIFPFFVGTMIQWSRCNSLLGGRELIWLPPVRMLLQP